MEGLQPLHSRVAGIDVHRMLHVVTVLTEQPDDSRARLSRELPSPEPGLTLAPDEQVTDGWRRQNNGAWSAGDQTDIAPARALSG